MSKESQGKIKKTSASPASGFPFKTEKRTTKAGSTGKFKILFSCFPAFLILLYERMLE
jgi:hypothetical protein